MTAIADQMRDAGIKKSYNKEMGDEAVLLKLVALCGGNATEAARLIGMTGSGVSAALNSGNVTKTVEMAARAALHERQVQEKDRLVILRLPKAQEDVVLKFLEALKIRYHDMGLR